MTTRRVIAVLAIMAWALALPRPGTADETTTESSGASRPSFERQAWPILAAHCAGCHGADKPKAGLDVRSVASMLRGGESGPALVRSDADASPLIQRIVAGEMPPEGQRRLTAEEIALLTAWVGGGAQAENPEAVGPPVSQVRPEDRQFWSFRPLANPQPPAVRQADRVRTPIDQFVLERLEAKGLGFSPDAAPETLARRAHLDLLGLPPSPDEVAAYRAGDANAFERLVDRLLASPHFGERWGRHWLDVAGYVDTVGFDTDATLVILSEGKWRYRDYVIRAFNQDKPYDRFITEQLAGDELFDWRKAEHLTPEMREALVATGYLRTARDLTHEDVGVIRQNFFGIMHDTLEIVGTGLLGLTLNCARCHSHKFDPIPQQDYYRLMSLLMPAYNPQAWRPVIPYEPKVRDRGLSDISPAEQAELERHNATIDEQLKEPKGKLAEIRSKAEARVRAAKLTALPEAIRADTKAAVDAPADKRNEVQKYLASKFGPSLKVKQEEITAAFDDAEKNAAGELASQVAAIDSGRRKWGKIQALYDVGPPPATHLLVRGNEETPGEEVVPGFLSVLCNGDADASGAFVPPYEGTSGRRLALAHWLTDPQSPASALVARVMVNRVWQQLFGRGIVPTSDNFGAQGQRPTHPELLEWLARDFVAGGWRIKPLIRQMMLSTAYRQSSREEAGPGETLDPGNELLWRMRLRRLESEAVRDAMLSVSGTLNPAAGGPPIAINARPDGMVTAAEKLPNPGDSWRRSLYFVTRRAYNLSILTTFDQPLVATNCLRRDTSAVPLQSLVMLNDAFVADQAEHFARRIERAGVNGDQRIAMAFRLALAREPTADEVAIGRELLARQSRLAHSAGTSPEVAAQQALAQLCLALFNTSEFLYIE